MWISIEGVGVKCLTWVSIFDVGVSVGYGCRYSILVISMFGVGVSVRYGFQYSIFGAGGSVGYGYRYSVLVLVSHMDFHIRCWC